MTQLATQDRQAQVVQYETERGEVALSVRLVREHFCPEATGAEAYAFIQLCKFHRLNPFLREAYIVKYQKDKPAQFFPGKDAWTSRAEQNPHYKGFKAGIVIGPDASGPMEYRESTLYTPEEKLIGGWCEVYRDDRQDPIRIEVALHEYDRKQSLWNSHKGTMIRKVALVQAHREAFPSMFAGLYDQSDFSSSELPDDTIVVEGSGTWLDPDSIGIDTETGEILRPDEAPDTKEDLSYVPEGYREIVEEAGGYGLDFEAFLKDVLAQPSIDAFEQLGGTPEIASKRFSNWLKGRK